MAKIILVTPTAEIQVGTIKATAEALQCAALLQALCTEPNYNYYVEHKTKRIQPDSLLSIVGRIKPLWNLLKPLYI